MILTVEEASTKRCQESYAPPLSAGGYANPTATITTASYGGVGSSYFISEMTSPAFCIGPKCMAWKWLGKTNDGQFTGYCGKITP
jgi:hypothetical protein